MTGVATYVLRTDIETMLQRSGSHPANREGFILGMTIGVPVN